MYNCINGWMFYEHLNDKHDKRHYGTSKHLENTHTQNSINAEIFFSCTNIVIICFWVVIVNIIPLLNIRVFYIHTFYIADEPDCTFNWQLKQLNWLNMRTINWTPSNTFVAYIPSYITVSRSQKRLFSKHVWLLSLMCQHHLSVNVPMWVICPGTLYGTVPGSWR